MTESVEPTPCRGKGCGRPLRTAASRARGMGKVCYDRANPATVRHHIPAGPAPRAAQTRSGRDLLDELQELDGLEDETP